MITLLLVVLAVLGVPLFAVLGLAALSAYWQVGLDPGLAAMEFIRIGELPMLAALPLFTFAGVLLGRSKTPARILDLSRAISGRRQGGLVVLALLLCAVMSALTGAPGLTLLVLSGLLLPGLAQAGYSDRASLGIVAAGPGLGLLLAPSLPLILYALIVGQVAPRAAVQLNDLFFAAVLPGLLILLLMAGYALRSRSHQTLDPALRKPFMPSLRATAWELPLPLVVIGGIYSGVLLALEAAVISAAWLLLSLVVIRREIRFSRLPAIISESMVLVAVILLILGLSMALATVLIDAGIPQRLVAWTAPFIQGRLAFLLLINLLIVLAGLLINGFAVLLILAPLLISLGLAFGVDPVHLGILFLVNLQIASLMPPLGINLALASHRLDRDQASVWRATRPYLGLLLIALLIITLWPSLSLALPELLGR